MPMNKDTLVFAISQSGETIDTLAALRESKRKGIERSVSAITWEARLLEKATAESTLHAGPEIGVAATKSFTSQITCLTLLALLLGRIRHLSSSQGIDAIQALESLPDKIRQVLAEAEAIRELAVKYADSAGFLFFGRQFNYPIALEGALKLKEISYRFAEGHPSAELKHGVIALVRPEVPSILIAPDELRCWKRTLTRWNRFRARNGKSDCYHQRCCKEIARLADDTIFVPRCRIFYHRFSPLCRCKLFLLTIWPCILVVMSINRVIWPRA